MDIFCSGGTPERRHEHLVTVPQVRTLNDLRRVLPKLGWRNEPLFGWTCPLHPMPAPERTPARDAIAAALERWRQSNRGPSAPPELWELG